MANELDLVLEIAKKFGIDEAIDLYTSKIEVKDWVVVKARHDSMFGKNWTWLPHAIPIEQMKQLVQQDYTRAVLVIGKEKKGFREALIAIEQELAAKGFPKALGIPAGACEPCENCKVNSAVPAFPEKIRPALEACGVDVQGTLKKFKKNADAAQQPVGIILLE